MIVKASDIKASLHNIIDKVMHLEPHLSHNTVIQMGTDYRGRLTTVESISKTIYLIEVPFIFIQYICMYLFFFIYILDVWVYVYIFCAPASCIVYGSTSKLELSTTRKERISIPTLEIDESLMQDSQGF